MIKLENLFTLPIPEEGKEIERILKSSGKIRIEIVTSGQNLPEKWYDQEDSEFVAVLRGHGELYFKKGNQSVKMNEGDYIFIPPHLRHKITKTSQNTLWLAVFYKE